MCRYTPSGVPGAEARSIAACASGAYDGLQKEHDGLQKRYQEKRDYKKIAKE